MRYYVAILMLFFLPLSCWAEGEVQGLLDYEYWENGNIRTCTTYDASGRLKTKSYYLPDNTVEKVEKFDDLGNTIEEALYDGNGELRRGIDGWAAMRWWYDGSQVVSQIAYDEYGKPIERKRYSPSGKLVFRQFMIDDRDLNPYEEANMYILLGNQNIAYAERE